MLTHEILCGVSLHVSDSWGFPNSPGSHLSVIHTYVHTYPTYFVFRSHQLCTHSSTKQVTICPKIPHIFVMYVHSEIHSIYYSEHIHLFRKMVTTVRNLAVYQLHSKLSLLEEHQGYCMSAPKCTYTYNFPTNVRQIW